MFSHFAFARRMRPCVARCSLLSAAIVFAAAFVGRSAWAQDQSAELTGAALETAKALETVDSSGASTFAANAPADFVYEGVVLNTPAQMSSQAADFNDENEGGANGSDIGNANPYWQIFVQSTQPNDFGGVAIYMAQNYGNIPGVGSAGFVGGSFVPDPTSDYSDAAWNAQVQRLDYYNNDQNTVGGATLSAGQQIQAGDEVIIFARGGLDFGGKYNINEEHTATTDYASDPQYSFDIFYVASHGMPTPIALNLNDYNGTTNPTGLWDASTDSVLFDATRATGAEHYQGDWVTLDAVKLVTPNDPNWVSNGVVTVENAAGNEFSVQLGTANFGSAPTGYFNATGIFDQESGMGPETGGYEVWVMNPTDIVATPEPSTLILAAIALGSLVGWKALRRRTVTT
ncbi:MAG TPA: PEP-CTERM sorting domain-containing protein [Pirellulales bacterium]|nr:PEP-CTERM sorting domain-containing protein [Pirellulales bacterium]